MKPEPDVYYFIGIGGIGMSALARYYHRSGKHVFGYDRSTSALTTALELEGITITYFDSAAELPTMIHTLGKERVVVVYTPAIPKGSQLLNWFRERGYEVVKRSEILGRLTAGKPTIAVAGTHGKTSTSSTIAHLLHSSKHGCNAFIGGILSNYNTNHLYKGEDAWNVVEADEYDRSFLTLAPDIAVITSTDADHLDVYGVHDQLSEAFAQFAKKLRAGGTLFINETVNQELFQNALVYGYSESCDFRIEAHSDATTQLFDLHTPGGLIENLRSPLPGKHNMSNTAVAIAVALERGVELDEIRSALTSFTGIKRRFEYQKNTGGVVFIDDYAHHPEELTATIGAARERHPGKRLTGIFQPHLFSRTRDFGDAFARSLELLDEVILLDIYPAREEPILGIDSQWLLDKIRTPHKKHIDKSQLLPLIREAVPEVLLTLGAGDIDREVEPIRKLLETLKNE